MNFKLGTTLLMASGLLLAACGAPASSEAGSTTTNSQTASTAGPSPSSTPSPTSTGPARNARGNLPKKIGEVAAAGGSTIDSSTLRFKVTSIEPITCDAPYAQQPVGIALAVALDVETTADFKGAVSVNGVPEMTSFSAYHWKGYTPTGTRMNQVDTVASQNCVADTTRLLPSSLGKGEKASGIVILEVTTPTGTIAYDGAGMVSSGWEWEYPAR